MRKHWKVAGFVLALGMTLWGGQWLMAQEEAPAPAEPVIETDIDAEEAAPPTAGFFTVIRGSGTLGVILWMSLFGASIAGVALIVDSFINIRVTKLIPVGMLDRVREAMEQGDLVKAMQYCEEHPGMLSNILTAGFSNVEEGFDVIQDVINAVADLESEKLVQRVTYLSVVGNLAPMLGLLGTVQGMIYAFGTLGTQAAGAAQQAMLAMNISQALYTTAAGLCIALPAVAFYYLFRNRANNIILSTVINTIDLVKVLRNVEVVES